MILLFPFIIFAQEPVIEQRPPSPVQKEVIKARSSTDCIKGYLNRVITTQTQKPPKKYPNFSDYEKGNCPPLSKHALLIREKANTSTVSTSRPPSQ